MNIFNDKKVPIQIDIESTDTNITTRILSVGVVNMQTGSKGYFKIHPSGGLNEARTTSKSTMWWWKNRSKVPQEAYDEAWSGTLHLQDALKEMKTWLKEQGTYKDLWVISNPSTFDCVIIDDAIRQAKEMYPHMELKKLWEPTHVSDYKGIARMAWGFHKNELIAEHMKGLGHVNELAHGALEDAVYQTKVCYEAWKELGREDGIIEPHVLDSIPTYTIG